MRTKFQSSGLLSVHSLLATLLAGFAAIIPRPAGAFGWGPASSPPSATALMLLLSDGRVMAQQSGGNGWYALTPDGTGNYANGSWGTLHSMNDSRTFYSSQVLRNGNVFVAGGEYGSGGAKAEVYNPLVDNWFPTPTAGVGFADSQSALLPNGNVLVSPVSWLPYAQWVSFIYDPDANSWSAGTSSLQYQDEATWVKLPDDSILTLDGFGDTSTERYIPALNQWIPDRNVPVQMFSAGNNEIGAAFMLPDGRAFFLGGTGHTLFYTPSGNTNQGTWSRGSDIPLGRVAQDAPAAMMPNGKILCEVSSPANHNPVYFYEYDPVADVFTSVGSPTGGASDSATSDDTYMLVLPTGNVLFSDTGGSLYIYQYSGSPVPAGKPAINSISWNANGSLHLMGTLLNGISSGAAYGDDAQMATSYPLVRYTDGGGNVSYARTHNWSSSGIMTGNQVLSTEFSVPPTLAPGAYSLVTVANGIASDPVTFYGPVWVDFNWLGAQFGDYAFPYNTLAQGVSAVVSGETIAIKPGSSHETMTISKPMTIIAVGGAATIGH
jgi:hypothetical protein